MIYIRWILKCKLWLSVVIFHIRWPTWAATTPVASVFFSAKSSAPSLCLAPRRHTHPLAALRNLIYWPCDWITRLTSMSELRESCPFIRCRKKKKTNTHTHTPVFTCLWLNENEPRNFYRWNIEKQWNSWNSDIIVPNFKKKTSLVTHEQPHVESSHTLSQTHTRQAVQPWCGFDYKLFIRWGR